MWKVRVARSSETEQFQEIQVLLKLSLAERKAKH